MQKNQLLKRISGVAAAVSLPILASAGVGGDTEVGSLGNESTTGTVRLTLNLTGTLRLRVFEREAGYNPGNSGFLADAAAATNQPRDTVDFGNVAFDGTSSTGAGVSAATDDGVAFIALLQADIFFTGASNADVTIYEGASSPIEAPGTATRGAGNDYEFYWDCESTAGSFTDGGGAWDSGTVFDPTGQDADTNTLSTSAAECYSTTTAGETVSRDVDLVIFLDENAPSGQYGADFVFEANVTP